MTDTLRQELDRVSGRYRATTRAAVLTVAWVVLAGLGVVAVVVASRHGVRVPAWVFVLMLAAAAVVIAATFVVLRRLVTPAWAARRIERKFPELNARLITAVEQQPDAETRRFGYFQNRVVAESLDHAVGGRWNAIVPAWAAVVLPWTQRVAAAAFVVVLGVMLWQGPSAERATVVAAAVVSVEPGDSSVERGSAVLVLARFDGRLPGDVRLLTKSAAGDIGTLAMSKSLDDPVFAARVPAVKSDLQYAVQYGREQTRWFKADVFDYPELKRADADLSFPDYTKLPARRVEDVRSVTAVEGTAATITLKLNKPVATAELRPANGETIKLTADASDPTTVTAKVTLNQSQSLKLKLIDADGRENKHPAAELAINVNPNRPPELKPVTPGRDVDVSPIQELSTGVRVSDDFGVRRVGVSYGIAGEPPQETILASDVPGGQKRDVSEVLSLEKEKAKPDQLLSYYYWAEDTAADGSVRRTSGDLYFAEVRPFEEIFRQGEPPAGGEQQQQQQGGNGQQAEELAELQKQIIAATWKIVRRETGTTPTAAFSPDVATVRESQTSAREQAAALDGKLTDVRSKGYLEDVLTHMDKAAASLGEGLSANAVAPLATALSAEQAAYQSLLRLRAREFDVTKGQQQQGQSASSSSGRRQQQLDQLQLDQEQNRYETQRSAAQQADNPQQRETRQVLSRLKELAQRQEDLNRQMQETKAALDQARDEQQREELQRQLSRLRDQQAQQLRDTDELRDRMDTPENQDGMADARQQLEQTRENVRRASEALQNGQVPEAAASGARASEQLKNLQEDVRKKTAGELADAMTGLRNEARALDEQQQQLSEEMKKADAQQRPSLRPGDNRGPLGERLAEQKQRLEKLLDSMKKTVDAAEATEPLASKQLYDTLRQAGQRQTDQNLDISRQLLDRGLANEARQAEAEAANGISQLRQGVEQAASGVLGDEAESLRRARAELDRLATELDREIGRNRPAGSAGDRRNPGDAATAIGPSTRPAGDGIASGHAPATRPRDDSTAIAAGPATTQNQTAEASDAGQDQSGAARPGERPANGQAPVGPRPGTGADGQNASARQQSGPGEQAAGGQPGSSGPSGQQGQSARPGQPGDQAQAGQRGPRGLRGQGGQPGSAGQSSADGENDAAPAERPANSTGEQANRRGRPSAGGGEGSAGDPNAPSNGLTGRGTDDAAEFAAGPITGENFRDWSDRLRDVEELVTDPKLRDRAAQIRERARDLRAEVKRHSKVPNWDAVQESVGIPLAELRQEVSRELLKRESPDALVPLDREAVPPQYAEQVRKYYERLGAGR